jgi:hypothetical protein
MLQSWFCGFTADLLYHQYFLPFALIFKVTESDISGAEVEGETSAAGGLYVNNSVSTI